MDRDRVSDVVSVAVGDEDDVAPLGLILLAAAVRAPLLNQDGIPALGITAVVACLVVFAVQVLLSGWGALPRGRLRASLRGR